LRLRSAGGETIDFQDLRGWRTGKHVTTMGIEKVGSPRKTVLGAIEKGGECRDAFIYETVSADERDTLSLGQ
jgi:hypothetical protein